MLDKSNVAATIPVKDMDKAKDFYEKKLGLSKVKGDDESGTLYKSGESRVFVYPSQFAGTNKATTATWKVDDVEKVVKDLKDKGVAFEKYDDMPGVKREGEIHIMGNMKTAWFKDPSDNILNVTDGDM